MRKAEDELKGLREENKLLKKLERFRGKPFLEENFEESRAFNRELIDLLKKGITLGSDDILASLHNETSDVDLFKSVNRKLETLESY